MTLGRLRIAAILGITAALLFALRPAVARANEWVQVCDVYGDDVAPAPGGVYGIDASTTCPGQDNPASYSPANPPGGMALWTDPYYTIYQGTAVHWTVTAPGGFVIDSVYIRHMYSQGR